MTLRLASCPHTGTKFLEAILGIEHRHIPDSLIEGWLDAGDQVVFPLRDPVLAYITMLNRQNNDRLAHHFSVMANYVKRPNTHVFRVDVPTADRPAELAALETFVGRPLHTDWRAVNETGIDPHDLKRAYVVEGAMPDKLTAFVDSLQQPVIGMLMEYGYEMPWLPNAWSPWSEPYITPDTPPGHVVRKRTREWPIRAIEYDVVPLHAVPVHIDPAKGWIGTSEPDETPVAPV